MIRRLVAGLALVLPLVLAPLVLLDAAPAQAEVNGSCAGAVNGIDVAPLSVSDPSQAIKVKKDAELSYFVGSSQPVRSRNFVLSYAGVDITVDNGSSSSDTNSTRRSGSVKVGDYAWMGAGLYQVAGVAHLSNGTTCSGAVLIDIEGNPLGTVAGITGLILTMLGGLGIIAGAIRQGGGKLVQDIIDFVALGTDDGSPGAEVAAPVGAGSTAAAAPPGAGGAGEPAAGDEPVPPPPGDKPPPRRRATPPPVLDPVGAGAVPPGAAGATPPVATSAATPATAHAGPTTTDTRPPTDAKPPPLPGMATVTAIGSTATALTEAANQLEGHIDSLPVTDAQKEKIKETLGTETIKDKLDTVTSTVETIEHFEGMATDTVDTMNRWGVNANGINGLIWLRTMTEAGGRLGQKYTDGIVKPILEPITKVANAAGIKADAGEIAKTLLPVQEVAEEGSKALLTAGKNVLGGDNVLDQLGKDPVVDEEWRNIRTFN